MRMYDLIAKKKRGEALTDDAIAYMVKNFVLGTIPDYQMAAMLMAICFSGMDVRETATLTREMAASGDEIDLSSVTRRTVDKHSTGGVGDKTTLICAPIVAAAGGKVAKMSGRGLGHTGGTIDKLESIPGFMTELPAEKFFRIVNEIGVSVIGQTGNLAPADKKLYALRDVTATVDSIPLIASSIMSKKLAAGAGAILVDVKVGSGAFMKTLGDAVVLAKTMVEIGEANGRRTAALITDMDTPLGCGIGNSIEVREAVDVLKGKGPEDLREEALTLAANMLCLIEKGSEDTCRRLAEKMIFDGSAFDTFKKMVAAQGGDISVLEDGTKFPQAACRAEVCAKEHGFISHMNAEKIGEASVILGAGRETKDAPIDPTSGIVLYKKYGDCVKEGEALATLYAKDARVLREAERVFRAALHVGEKPPVKPLVYARVEKGQVTRYAQRRK